MTCELVRVLSAFVFSLDSESYKIWHSVMLRGHENFVLRATSVSAHAHYWCGALYRRGRSNLLAQIGRGDPRELECFCFQLQKRKQIRLHSSGWQHFSTIKEVTEIRFLLEQF